MVARADGEWSAISPGRNFGVKPPVSRFVSVTERTLPSTAKAQ